jgi:hypothetical protein
MCTAYVIFIFIARTAIFAIIMGNLIVSMSAEKCFLADLALHFTGNYFPCSIIILP